MTLNLSENSWAKAGLIAAALVAAVLAWSYLAGGIFLLTYDQSFDNATPLTIYHYWTVLGADKPAQLRFVLSGIGAVALLHAPVIAIFAPAKRKLHGDARFATRREISDAGLFGEKGIIVGKIGKKYLMLDGETHVEIMAPQRSGKSTALSIPNMLHWPDSAVVIDVRQEIWDITSGYRKKHGQECYLYNPLAVDGRTHRQNPLLYVSQDPNLRIDDVQKIAHMFYPDSSEAPIWTATPRTLFTGIVLYLLETPGKLSTIGQVLRESLVDGDGAEYFKRIVADRAKQYPHHPLSDTCIGSLNSYSSMNAEATRAGVISGFRARLELWMNPLVDAATSANDFDLRDLRKRRMTVYLGVTPDNLARLAPLLNLFMQQLVDLNTREMPNKNPAIKYKCLLLNDEFTALGRIPAFEKGISYLGGYWLRVMTIIQSPEQLVAIYGRDAAKNYSKNHALKIVYPPKASDTEVAREISEMLGYQTVMSKSDTTSKGFFGNNPGSENKSPQRRALLLPQEISTIGKTREIVIMENLSPFLATRATYFKDRQFIDRLKSISPRLRALGKKLPNKAQIDAAIFAGELAAEAPCLDIKAHHQLINSKGGITTATFGVSNTSGKEKTMQRAVTVDDMPKLNKLSLANFAVDFSSVTKPRADDLNESVLHAYADSLCTHAGITF